MLRMAKAIEGKNRDEVIAMMMRLANEAIKQDNGKIEKVIWAIADEWNRNHSDDKEIFMDEYWNEDDSDVLGFYIEDDYWLYE